MRHDFQNNLSGKPGQAHGPRGRPQVASRVLLALRSIGVADESLSNLEFLYHHARGDADLTRVTAETAERDRDRAAAAFRDANGRLAKWRAEARLAFAEIALRKAQASDEVAHKAFATAERRYREAQSGVQATPTDASPPYTTQRSVLAEEQARNEAAWRKRADDEAYYAPENAEARRVRSDAAEAVRTEIEAMRQRAGAPPDWRDTGKE